MLVTSGDVEFVRDFNRFYTKLIGVLGERLLGMPYSLGEARVIFELGQRPATEIGALRSALGLETGYLDRMLARFTVEGLIAWERPAGDGRPGAVRLTEAGRKVCIRLDQRATGQAETLLVELPSGRRARLVTAMRTIQDVLGDAPRRVRLRPLEAGDYGWVVHAHAAVYAAEYGWDSSYVALIARIVADYIDGCDPAWENAWLAELDGEPVGSVFCMRKEETVAQLRLLLVEPSARGYGIGGRLVNECLRFATAAGYGEIMLWTNDCLTVARQIYERAGFALEAEEPHHSFGADLVGQFWRKNLRSREPVEAEAASTGRGSQRSN
jgi:DNA-binding MarR family transcriptional regulator/GNAT superfamily N-acetyltransferase